MALSIQARVDDVLSRVASACARVGRPVDGVAMVVVTKGRSDVDVRAVYDAGIRLFAENRAQPLRDRIGVLPEDAAWQFVGPLQRNKVRLVRPVVSLLQSMDRPQLAAAWLKGPGAPPPVLLQVNIGLEPQKAGVSPAEAPAFADQCASMGLSVQGLMAIPPNPSDPETSRPHFAAMRQLRDRLAVDHPTIVDLSMGMTADFEVAVEEGATIIRPGRAIFGALDSGSA